MAPDARPSRPEDETFALADETGEVYDFTPPPNAFAEWAKEQPRSVVNRPEEVPASAPSASLGVMLVAGVLALAAVTALAVWLQ